MASDDVGFGLKDISRTGVHWILTSWRLELLERPAWRAALRVETWPRTMDGFLSDRDFLVWDGGRLAAKGSSRWVLMSAATGRLTRVDASVRAAYQSQLDGQAVFGGAAPDRKSVV